MLINICLYAWVVNIPVASSTDGRRTHHANKLSTCQPPTSHVQHSPLSHRHHLGGTVRPGLEARLPTAVRRAHAEHHAAPCRSATNQPPLPCPHNTLADLRQLQRGGGTSGMHCHECWMGLCVVSTAALGAWHDQACRVVRGRSAADGVRMCRRRRLIPRQRRERHSWQS